jgi:small neutral amino acid transporter SnatA (MarC family)
VILNERYLDEERISGGIILLFVGISFISASEIPFRIIANKERHKKEG